MRNDDKNKFTTVFAVCDTPTPTGRIYPAAVMKAALAEYQKQIDDNTAFGLLADFGDPYPPQHLSIQDVSHRVVHAEMVDEREIVMTIEALDTPQGERLYDMLQTSRACEAEGLKVPIKGHLTGKGKVTEGVVEDYTIMYTTIGIGERGSEGEGDD